MQAANPDDFETYTGFRPVFTHLPSTKNMAQKSIMPIGVFYSPFIAEAADLKKGKFPICS